MLYLDYVVAGEPWFEMAVLQHLGREDYVVTPDMEVYVETLSLIGTRAIKEGRDDWALPEGLGAAHGPTNRVRWFAARDRFTTDTKVDGQPTADKLRTTLPAPPSMAVVRSTRTTGIGASGEMRSTAP